jgi:hypothetical protein
MFGFKPLIEMLAVLLEGADLGHATGIVTHHLGSYEAIQDAAGDEDGFLMWSEDENMRHFCIISSAVVTSDKIRAARPILGARGVTFSEGTSFDVSDHISYPYVLTLIHENGIVQGVGFQENLGKIQVNGEDWIDDPDVPDYVNQAMLEHEHFNNGSMTHKGGLFSKLGF